MVIKSRGRFAYDILLPILKAIDDEQFSDISVECSYSLRVFNVKKSEESCVEEVPQREKILIVVSIE